MSLFKIWVDHSKKDSFVNTIRKKRFAYQKLLIEKLLETKETINILDIGGEIEFWKHLGWDNKRCTIYLLNLESVPTIKPTPGFIQLIIWSFAKIQLTGIKPPEIALPIVIISGLSSPISCI